MAGVLIAVVLSASLPASSSWLAVRTLMEQAAVMAGCEPRPSPSHAGVPQTTPRTVTTEIVQRGPEEPVEIIVGCDQ